MLLKGFKATEITGYEVGTARTAVHNIRSAVPLAVTSLAGSVGLNDV